MDILMEILQPILLTLAGIVGAYIAYWLKQHININKFKEKQALVEVAVKFIEQAYKDLDGAQKYARAVEWLSAEANKKGLKMSDTEMKALIEATIKSFKDEFAKQW